MKYLRLYLMVSLSVLLFGNCTREHRVAPVLRNLDSLSGYLQGTTEALLNKDTTLLVKETQWAANCIKRLDSLGSDTFSVTKKWIIEKYFTSSQNISVFIKNSNMLISFKQKLTERLNLIRQDLVSGAIEELQAKNLIQKEEAYIREYKKSLKTETEKFTQEWDTCKHYKNIVLQRFY